MADNKKKEMTPAQEIEALKAQLKQREDEVKNLKTEVAKQAPAPAEEKLPVAVSWKTPTGKPQKRKVIIKTPTVRLRDQDSSIVGAAALLKVANGKSLSKEELEASPALKGFSKASANELIAHLCKINSGILEDAK